MAGFSACAAKDAAERGIMYVKDHMTANPFTVTEDTVISKAMEIMAKNHFHMGNSRHDDRRGCERI